MADIRAFVSDMNDLSREHGIAITGDYDGSYLVDTETGEELARGPHWIGDQYQWYVHSAGEKLKVRPVTNDD